MANIILVHGMNANEKSWFGVPDFLMSEHHFVVAISLPGHDKPFGMPGDPNIGMSDYIARIEEFFPEGGEEVVLIGHSMGGQVISHVAANFPHRIDRLIYVAGMLPQDGESANDIKKASNSSPLNSALQMAPYLIRHRNVFSSQPENPLNEAFKLPDVTDGDRLEIFNAMKRFYVVCTRDQVLPAPHQKAMTDAADLKSDRIVKIASDHIPQKSQASDLHEALRVFIAAT